MEGRESGEGVKMGPRAKQAVLVLQCEEGFHLVHHRGQERGQGTLAAVARVPWEGVGSG